MTIALILAWWREDFAMEGHYWVALWFTVWLDLEILKGMMV